MQRDLHALKAGSFDLLVCGGGIYGAWTAYDAALRGLRVALVEQNDWASGTSSASTKLIHGGLRYLETLDFGLVKKALAERELLLRAGPHRVWPLRFGIPVYRSGRLGPWRLRAGLSLYDLLAGAGREEWHQAYRAEAFLARFPWIEPRGLRAGFSYRDAQTDDARLVLELVDGAIAAGAVCANYCKVRSFIETEGRVCGAELDDSVGAERFPVRARCVVNATGQWSRFSAGEQALPYRLSKGVHLVMPPLPGEAALLFPSRADDRVIFIIPWYGQSLLGTTDTDYAGNVDRVTVDDASVEYLLAEVNAVLKTDWERDAIRGGFAGLRVLAGAAPGASSRLSREWGLKELTNGMLVSIGGKLTTARQDAAVIVDRVCVVLGRRAQCQTACRSLPWAPALPYPAWLQGMAALGQRLGVDAEAVRWLVARHGRRLESVYRLIVHEPRLKQRIFPAVPLIRADLLHCAGQEMVMHLEDLLRRRLPLLILHPMTESELTALGRELGEVLGWDPPRRQREIDACAEKWLMPSR